MDLEFVQSAQTLIDQCGKELLFDLAAFKSRLPKSAQETHKKERHVLYIAIDIGAPKEIEEAQDLAATKQTLIDRLKNSFFVSEFDAKETIELLSYILRGDKSLNIVSAASRHTREGEYPNPKKILWIAFGALIILLIVIFLVSKNATESDPQEPPIDDEAKVILVQKGQSWTRSLYRS
jgi:hypothetical protein